VYVFPACGKQHFYEVSFEITSPGYPDVYGPDLDCLYYIHNPFNHLLTITFQRFAIEYNSNNCNYDYLKVSISHAILIIVYWFT